MLTKGAELPEVCLDMDLVMERQSQTQDVKTRTEVGARCGNINGHFFTHRVINFPSSMACFICRAAAAISSWPHTARTTATRWAPEARTRPTLAASIPPIATCGVV